MQNLTLVIPAKFESTTLPNVLKEIDDLKLNCKKIVVVPAYDKETIDSIKKFDCRISIQKGEGFGNALIQGLNESDTEYSCILMLMDLLIQIFKSMIKKLRMGMILC